MLSQEALATKAAVARSAITNLEAGGVARAATIQRLAKALGVEADDLMRQPPGIEA
jgi:transcriptional regulator with XRE-family HTH domain